MRRSVTAEKDVYAVQSYDAYDAPGERTHEHHGPFELAEDAEGAARAIVEESLRSLLNRAPSNSEELLSQFADFGEIPMIFGEPRVSFDPFTYAASIAPAILESMKR